MRTVIPIPECSVVLGADRFLEGASRTYWIVRLNDACTSCWFFRQTSARPLFNIIFLESTKCYRSTGIMFHGGCHVSSCGRSRSATSKTRIREKQMVIWLSAAFMESLKRGPCDTAIDNAGFQSFPTRIESRIPRFGRLENSGNSIWGHLQAR